MTTRAYGPHCVLGIIIADTLTAEVAQVAATYTGPAQIRGPDGKVKRRRIEQQFRPGDRAQQAEKFLKGLSQRAEIAPYLDEIAAVCVSSIGFVSEGSVWATGRHGWPRQREDGKPLIGVHEILKEQFLRAAQNRHIDLYNDTTLLTYAEYYLGRGQEEHIQEALSENPVFAYVRVSYGVNAGMLWVSGKNKLRQRKQHPELAQQIVIPHGVDLANKFTGNCNFHKNCIEGLGSFSAMCERWGIEPEPQEDALNALAQHFKDPEKRDVAAYYLGYLVAGLALAIAPPQVVLGGIIIERFPKLRDEIYAWACAILNRYPGHLEGKPNYVLTSTVPSAREIDGPLLCAAHAIDNKSIKTIK